jgi:hypothetical protein
MKALLDFRKVSRPYFTCGFGHTFIVTYQENVHTVESGPAPYGIALDHPGVPMEWLWNREDGDHGSRRARA